MVRLSFRRGQVVHYVLIKILTTLVVYVWILIIRRFTAFLGSKKRGVKPQRMPSRILKIFASEYSGDG